MWDAVDRIEETKESDSTHWTTEGLSESTHVLEKLFLLPLLLFVALQPALPFLKGPRIWSASRLERGYVIRTSRRSGTSLRFQPEIVSSAFAWMCGSLTESRPTWSSISARKRAVYAPLEKPKKKMSSPGV